MSEYENNLDENEAGRQGPTQIGALVENIVREAKAGWQAEIAKELAGFRAPVGRAPELINAEGETVLRLTSPYARVYARMSEEERQWRSPDSDHWCAEWLKGQAFRNHGQMLQAAAKLEGIYGRATTTEGVAAASGGLSTGTGGALIPRPLEQVVMIARDRVSKMRRWAQRFQMTAQTHTVPTAGAMTANMVGESTTSAQGEPTIASVQLTAKKGQVKAVATKEIFRDAAINLINLFGARGGAALGVLEDNQFFKNGDGTGNNISSFMSGTAFTETTSGAMAWVDMVSMYHSVEQQYRANAVWLLPSNVLQLFTLLRNATTGAQFYLGLMDKPGPISDDATAEGTIMRRPVYEVPFTNGTVWFGDPNATYLIGDRQGIESEVSDQVRFETDEVVWKLTQRFDGQAIDAVGAQVATGITSVTDAAA